MGTRTTATITRITTDVIAILILYRVDLFFGGEKNFLDGLAAEVLVIPKESVDEWFERGSTSFAFSRGT